MNLNWLKEHTIYVTLHGSQCHGLANEFSDTDVKGIFISPKEVEYNLYERVDQVENNIDIEKSLEHLKNPKNPKFESTIYSLRKFFILAADVNPNIIELLFTDPKDHFIFKHPMDKIIENRNLFLSNQARFTFSGYAIAQAKKIERHKKWIVLGEVKSPSREEFGLPPVPPRGMDEVYGYIKVEVEKWNLNQYSLDEMDRANLKETIWELITNITQKDISVANWPEKYADGVIYKLQKELNLKDDVISFINAERSYNKALQVYNSWISWKTERNPARRQLEEKSGYDTKHASHLIRLLRQGYEIISTGKVNVNRTGIDADELLNIKNGGWTYEKVIEHAEEIQKKLENEYNNQKKLLQEGKPTPLPKSVDKEKINKFYCELYEEYWKSK